MIKITIATIIMIFLAGCATNNAESVLEKDYSYKHIGVAEGKTKAEIFNLAEDWFARNYQSSNEVVQVSDLERGRIIGKGIWPITVFLNKARLDHTIQVDVRDGEYRVIIDQMHYSLAGGGVGGVPISELESMLKGSVEKSASFRAVETFESLRLALESDKADDDW